MAGYWYRRILGNILYLPFYLLNFFVSICFKLNEEQNLCSPIYHFWTKKKRKRKKYLILCNLHVLFGLFVVFGHFFLVIPFFVVRSALEQASWSWWKELPGAADHIKDTATGQLLGLENSRHFALSPRENQYRLFPQASQLFAYWSCLTNDYVHFLEKSSGFF